MKAGFDCTRKRSGEDLDGLPLRGDTPEPVPDAGAAVISAAREVPGVIEASCPGECREGWLFARIEKFRAGQGREAAHAIGTRLATVPHAPGFVVVLAGDVRTDDLDEAMFHWAASSDASRDWQQVGSILCIDATPKLPGDGTREAPVRAWPPFMRMSDVVSERVAARWSEYGLA